MASFNISKLDASLLAILWCQETRGVTEMMQGPTVFELFTVLDTIRQELGGVDAQLFGFFLCGGTEFLAERLVQRDKETIAQTGFIQNVGDIAQNTGPFPIVPNFFHRGNELLKNLHSLVIQFG